jgi:alanine racemase
LNTLHLHLTNLDHNYKIIRDQIHDSTQCIGVIKANAYGGDAIYFAKRLELLGIDKLAVAYTEEGIQLRKQGIKTPIMVFYPQMDSLRTLIAADLEPCLYSKKLLKSFKDHLDKMGIEQYPIHIKYNTGLNRVGFPLDHIQWVLEKTQLSQFKLESVYSHLAASEEERPSKQCSLQISHFEKIRKKHIETSRTLPKFHLLNSSGIFNYPEFQYDIVRCGIAFHGFANTLEWDNLLKPVAVLKSKISQLHQVEEGASVGYDNGWIAPEAVTIATLPIGHADGIGRHFGHSRTSVSIHQQEAPIVGNICMDMLMVNVTGINCKEGDEVTFFGLNKSANSVAESGNTISYELLAGIGPRVKRIVHS